MRYAHFLALIFIITIIELLIWAFSITCYQRKPPVLVRSNPNLAWALALNGILGEHNQWDLTRLGGVQRNETNRIHQREGLRFAWGIKSKEDVLKTLQWLARTGHSYDFKKLEENLRTASQPVILSPDAETQNKISLVYKHARKLGPTGIRAWDIGRYISICNAAYIADYLSLSEAWGYILPTAVAAQRMFTSWEGYSHSYLIGREFWSLEQTRYNGAEMYRIADLLLSSTNSPWIIYPWNTDLNLPIRMTEAAEQWGNDNIANAESLFRKAVKMNPSGINENHDLARFLASEDKLWEAITVFQRVIDLAPGSYPAYIELAHVYHRIQLFEKEEGILRKALKIFNTSDVHLLLGKCLKIQNRLTDAAQILKAGYSISSSSLIFPFFLGETYYKSGNLSAAATEYEKVFYGRGDSSSASALATVLYYAKQIPEAQRLFWFSIMKNPRQKPSYISLGIILGESGWLKEHGGDLSMGAKWLLNTVLEKRDIFSLFGVIDIL